MIARMHKSMKEKDQGFTLIELLVVMIIIGILAAIAIPVFLNQRKKAVDSAARSDVSTLGKEIATYYVDATTDALPVIAEDAKGHYTLTGTTAAGSITTDLGKVSKGITFKQVKGNGTAPSTNAASWCVDVSVAGGTLSATSYSALDGLTDAACV